MLIDDERSWGFRSSTGLDFTHASIVDAHFEACRRSYSDLLNGVGIQPGWQVLDAGCGTGSFLPLLADLVGPTGRVCAVDLAEEHVTLATRRARGIHAVRADLLHLPHADGSFDAAWCANTTQYLDDRQLRQALAELRRVVRPGGMIAIKDLDASLVTARPGDPFLFTDFFRLAAESSAYARQLLRTRDMCRFLAGAGLTGIRQRTVLIEHIAPLSPAATAFYGPSCAQLARQAIRIGAPGDWSVYLDPHDPANPLNHPRAYISEGNVLAVGTVPG
jgi:ubiquinone/menaquinone biosynthesis C-methylase UbiE